MKNFVTKFMFTVLLAVAFSLTSCQEEFEELPKNNNEQAIVASSSTAKLIKGTSSKDGSFDNIVDGASCFAVQFPYKVSIDGLDITIDSIEDLELIEEIFDTVETDDDILEIIFPITITLADYTEITINDKEELKEIAKDCIEGGDDDDIECIDFVYPITLYTFSVDLEKTSTVSVENDKELRRFFAGINDNELVSFDFPVTLKKYDGTKIIVNSNAELAIELENAKEICDEDDDNDYNDDDFTKERLDEYLVKCPWLIKDVIRDDLEKTEQYYEYLIDFNKDGSILVKDREGNSFEGSWGTRIGNDRVLLELGFNTLVDFNLEWFVYELGDGKIKLYANDGKDRIVMKRHCEEDNTSDILQEVLKECSWIIKKTINNGQNVNRLVGFQLEFKADSVVTLSNGTETFTGSWVITLNDNKRLIMAITMTDEPGVSFEWQLSDLRDDYLKFEISDSPWELILESNCDNDANDEDVIWIRKIFNETLWGITLFSENGDETTETYVDKGFRFNTDGKIVVIDSNYDEIDKGRWYVYRNSEGTLEMIINFSDSSNYHPLANDYMIFEINENKISLKHKNENEEGYDKLVFEIVMW